MGSGADPPSPPLLGQTLQVILTFIVIDVQYVQKVVSSFEKSSNGQNHSSSDSDHPKKKIPPQNLSLRLLEGYPLSRNAISKTLNCPFAPKEVSWGKLGNISIIFSISCFPSCLSVSKKKSLEQIMTCKVAQFLGKLHSNFPHATKGIFLEKLY